MFSLPYTVHCNVISGTSSCLSSALGRGTLRYMKGSKETETCEHSEQMTVFLNWPWKVVATTVLFLARYLGKGAGRWE